MKSKIQENNSVITPRFSVGLDGTKKNKGFSPDKEINMSYVKIWIHAVWGTKFHQPILNNIIRSELFNHIRDNAKEKEIYIDFINGYVNHVHCLLALNADMSISKTMQLIKGESAFWANGYKLMQSKLEWANEYFAISVSESMIDKVRNYIKNQEEHHRKVSFQEEYNEFIKRYKFVHQG